MKLVGIELQNFRSIGEKPVVLYPIQQCNILIGQNNSGKSNIIRAIQRIPQFTQEIIPPGNSISSIPIEDLDIHNRDNSHQFIFTLKFKHDNETSQEARLAKFSQDGFFDFKFIREKNAKTRLIDTNFARIQEPVKMYNFCKEILGFTPDSLNRISSEQVLEYIPQIFKDYFVSCIQQVSIIPEFRQIRSGKEYSLNGENLIEVLDIFQHPEIGNDDAREKFDRIQNFIRYLLHLPNALLEVTHGNKLILTSDNLRLPLSSYGTGVHELVIMLTAILLADNTVCCIEEPEIHLHPSLQREFIVFLTTQPTNTFFLSTHSSTFINALSKSQSNQGVQIFHLRKEEGATVGGAVLTDLHSLSALGDLGVKASDILQSNSIIWVEGPSDRIYLNRWINLVAPELIEGLHYSIMFYGGRLLSHLSTERDEAPEELIDLLRINQHTIIMIDSDRKKASDPVNTTKQRIYDECEKSECVCWITDGREVENYLSSRVVNVTSKLLFEDIQFEQKLFRKFDDAIAQALKVAGYEKDYKYSGDKVRFAKMCVQQFTEEDLSDVLRERIEFIVEKIQSWNL